jgi:hypothetical protein
MSLQKRQQATATRHEKKPKPEGTLVLPVLTKSLSQTSFVSYPDLKKKMNDYIPSDFEPAFFQRASYRGFSDSIELSDVSHVVLGTLGELTSEYILDKAMKMATNCSKFRVLSWDAFSGGIGRILEVIREEAKIGREKQITQPLPNTADKGLGSGYLLSTNYRENFQKGSMKTSKPILYNPDINPIANDLTFKTQQMREIKPLYAGSPISVGHLPSYLGHVPKNITNPKKADQSRGHSRPMHNDLLLTQRGLGCIGGYSGHNPQYWTTDSIERTVGMDPRTTQGAAFGPERRIL